MIPKDLKECPLKAGQVFQAKKPKGVGIFDPLYDDRQILHVTTYKQSVGHIDHGFNQEFLDWCKESSFRYTFSEIDQLEYEVKTGKNAKNIEVIWDYKIQYDSPALKFGKKYPSITLTKFLKWAGKEITDEMPKGEWRKVEKDETK